MYTIHSSNLEFLQARILPGSGDHDPGCAIPMQFDAAVPDHCWRLYCDHRPASHCREIMRDVGQEIRETIRQHRNRHGIEKGD